MSLCAKSGHMRRSGDISLSALLEGHLPGLLEQLRLPLLAAPFKRVDALRTEPPRVVS